MNFHLRNLGVELLVVPFSTVTTAYISFTLNTIRTFTPIGAT